MTLFFYLIAAALCGLSAILIRDIAPSMETGHTPALLHARKAIGRVLIAVAAVAAVTGAVDQFMTLR
jgi:hypothetical protein